MGVKISKVREISRTAEKIDKKCLPRKIILKNVTPTPPKPPHPPHPPDGGGGFRGENFKVTKHQVLKSISGMQLSWTKPGNPREGG